MSDARVQSSITVIDNASAELERLVNLCQHLAESRDELAAKLQLSAEMHEVDSAEGTTP